MALESIPNNKRSKASSGRFVRHTFTVLPSHQNTSIYVLFEIDRCNMSWTRIQIVILDVYYYFYYMRTCQTVPVQCDRNQTCPDSRGPGHGLAYDLGHDQRDQLGLLRQRRDGASSLTSASVPRSSATLKTTACATGAATLKEPCSRVKNIARDLRCQPLQTIEAYINDDCCWNVQLFHASLNPYWWVATRRATRRG